MVKDPRLYMLLLIVVAFVALVCVTSFWPGQEKPQRAPLIRPTPAPPAPPPAPKPPR